MTQASRRRLEAVDAPAGRRVPARPRAGARCRSARRGDLTELLQDDLARLEQGDLAEAAETWAALLAGRRRGRSPAGSAHLVLTDHDELRALAGATRRPGRGPARRPRGRGRAARGLAAPVRRRRHARGPGSARRESLDEPAGPTPATPPRPRCRAGPIGRAPGSASWRPDRRVVDQHRPGQPRRRAARGGRPARLGRWPSSARAAGARRRSGWSTARCPAGSRTSPLGLVVLTDRELFGATRVRRLTPVQARRHPRPDRQAGARRPASSTSTTASPATPA